eukprot:80738_1
MYNSQRNLPVRIHSASEDDSSRNGNVAELYAIRGDRDLNESTECYESMCVWLPDRKPVPGPYIIESTQRKCARFSRALCIYFVPLAVVALMCRTLMKSGYLPCPWQLSARRLLRPKLTQTLTEIEASLLLFGIGVLMVTFGVVFQATARVRYTEKFSKYTDTLYKKVALFGIPVTVYFALGIVIQILVSEAIKPFMSEPRPDFFARCFDIPRVSHSESDIADAQFVINTVYAHFGDTYAKPFSTPSAEECAVYRETLRSIMHAPQAVLLPTDRNLRIILKQSRLTVATKVGASHSEDVGSVSVGFRSFPSGHSSSSCFMTVYFTMYMVWLMRHRHLLKLDGSSRRSSGSKSSLSQESGVFARARFYAFVCLWSTLTVGVVVTGVVVCVTRVTDNRHHVWDVLAGCILGSSVAVFTFLRFTQYCGSPTEPDGTPDETCDTCPFMCAPADARTYFEREGRRRSVYGAKGASPV